MPTFVFIHDCVCPDDPQGRTYKEINAEKGHNIPLGALVERPDGVRAFVVQHTRDCDMTPLYELSSRKEDVGKTSVECGAWSIHIRAPHWDGGFCEDNLTVVSLAQE